MPKPPQEISDEAKARLAVKRSQAQVMLRGYLEQEGQQDGSLAAVAFLAGVRAAADELIGPAIDQARADRYTWREISEAEGEGDSREAADRAYLRQSRRPLQRARS